MKKIGFLLAGVLAFAVPTAAEKLSNEFKSSFEKTFKPKRTYAVVMKDGVPTTSIYGIEGTDSGTAHFSIDVVDGDWTASTGLFDTAQVAADTLDLGEILELDSISYKDNRVDMRFVSVESHKVKRGDWILKTEKREPVATNFKFFLPFEKKQVLGPPHMEEIIRYVEGFLRVFPNEDAARAYSAKLARGRDSGGSRPTPAAARPAARSGGAKPTASEKKEIKVGMTPLEVIDVLGKPQKEVSFQNQQKWTYPDLTVIFENGKVKEVRF
jgi:hypothetical protein